MIHLSATGRGRGSPRPPSFPPGSAGVCVPCLRRLIGRHRSSARLFEVYSRLDWRSGKDDDGARDQTIAIKGYPSSTTRGCHEEIKKPAIKNQISDSPNRAEGEDRRERVSGSFHAFAIDLFRTFVAHSCSKDLPKKGCSFGVDILR